MFQKKDIAIVVLNWNGKALLEQFLPSLKKHSSDAKIYVADNASTDDSIKFVEEQFSNITIIKNDKNYGFAEGYNKALQYINEPLLCLLNNDVEVTHSWLEPVLHAFNNDSKIGVVQPKLLDFKHRNQFEYAGAAGGYLDKYGFPFCRGRVFNSLEMDIGQYDDTKEIVWASGACFFIKNKLFEELNGFDEAFFAHMEEIDLCWRAFNLEQKIIYVGGSTVYHVGGATLNNSNPEKTFLNFRNSLFTLTKNTDKHLYQRLFFRMVLDGVAALRFLFLLMPRHFFAVLRAHFAFYGRLSKVLRQRKGLNKRSDYFKTNSIVWNYFILGKRRF